MREWKVVGYWLLSRFSGSRYRLGCLYNGNTMETIELRDVNVSLGGNSILNDMSMSVEPGRVHALLGRNGAGKSTAFKTILGLVPVTSGAVNILGEPLNAGHRRDIGASINGPALYGHLTARENLKVHTLLLGLPDAEIDRVLELVGLSETGRKKAKSFSTGMKARLALAIAMLGSPKILLLDEPQNGLDPQGIADLRVFLKEWAQHGGTVVVSSHQLGEIARLADDITVIESGKTVFSGAADYLTQGGDLESRFFHLTHQLPDVVEGE